VTEDYVRPPTVALPPPDHRLAMWRFRIVVGAMLFLLIVIIVLVARAIVHQGDGTGTVGMSNAPSLGAVALATASR
jgi:hypothetical protein